MKTSKKMEIVGADQNFRSIESAELRSVQGGDLGLVMAGLIGLSKLNDYLAKLAVDKVTGASAIPIEPLT